MVIENGLGHLARDFRRRFQRFDAHPRLAVVADAHLHHSRLDFEIGMADRWKRARPEADANRATVVDRLLRYGLHLFRAAAERRFRAADLPHQNLAGNAAAFLAFARRRGADVVVGYDGENLDAFLSGELDRHFDVHVVARVVSIEADHPAAAVGDLHRVKEALGGRRGEDFSHRNRIEHVVADVADEGWLVARPPPVTTPTLPDIGAFTAATTFGLSASLTRSL